MRPSRHCRPSAGSQALLLGLLLALPSGFAAGPVRADDLPVVTRSSRGLELRGVPDLLSAPEVGSHLTSGLTTTFVFRVMTRDGGRQRARSEGWVAIRYELWDEVFLVAAGGFFGARRGRISSFDELLEWWKAPRGNPLASPGLEPSDSWQVKVEVDLIPFSRSEQRDAQRWLADALGTEQGGAAESVTEVAEDGPDPTTNVFNLLLATSIRRDSLVTWSWTVEAAPPRGASP